MCLPASGTKDTTPEMFVALVLIAITHISSSRRSPQTTVRSSVLRYLGARVRARVRGRVRVRLRISGKGGEVEGESEREG